jgi:transketolase
MSSAVALPAVDPATDPATVDPAAKTAEIREHIVDMCACPSGGHLGGSMSLVEILATLYFRILRVDPDACDAPDRDVLLLSKGHGGIGLYATLCVAGFFPVERLAEYAEPGSPFMAHPHPEVPGVEMPSGSLGHGLALGIGFALGARLDGSERRTFVIMGDGELQEGSVWESAAVAASQGLTNLTAIVDRNGLQITGETEEVGRLEPLADKWRAFGWTVREVDGHDIGELTEALEGTAENGRPTLVLAHTTKGKGLPFIEDQVKSHFATLGERQHQKALAVLRNTARRSRQ